MKKEFFLPRDKPSPLEYLLPPLRLQYQFPNTPPFQHRNPPLHLLLPQFRNLWRLQGIQPERGGPHQG